MTEDPLNAINSFRSLEGVLVDPLPPQDKLVAEVADMGDRTAEAGQPELEKDTPYFPADSAAFWSPGMD
jgi:hypothetical protein